MTETLQLVYEAIDELNETRDEPLPKREDLDLAGKSAALDSMGLVTLIVSLEQLVEERLGKAIALASEKAFSCRSSPFRTPATLAAYIDELLQEADGGNG